MSELPDDVRLSIDNPTLLRLLRRLSREALVDLVQQWTASDITGVCPPSLDPASLEENHVIGPAPDLPTLAKVYQQLLEAKASKKELLERLTEIDWVGGLSMKQIANVEYRDLVDRPNSMRWSAMRISRLKIDHDDAFSGFALSANTPCLDIRFGGLSEGIKTELGSLFKMHFYVSHYAPLGMDMLRITAAIGDCYVHDKTIVSADEGAINLRSVWLAMRPGDEQHIFVSPPAISQVPQQGHHVIESAILGAIPSILASPAVRCSFRPSQHDALPLEQIDRVVRGQTASELPLGYGSGAQHSPLLSINQ